MVRHELSLTVSDVFGVAVLDRTFALYRSGSWDPKWQIYLLPLDKFFVGTIAKHYQLSTWVSILWAVREIIALAVLAVVGAAAAGAYAMRWYLLRQQQLQQAKGRFE